jgi:hypothetical protein
MEEFGLLDSLIMTAKILVAGILMACGYAGVTVGPSAATKKARWALLLAFMCFAIPSAASEIIWGSSGYALDPGNATDDVVAALFEDDAVRYGIVGGMCLVVWGALGSLLTATRVRREMIP